MPAVVLLSSSTVPQARHRPKMSPARDQSESSRAPTPLPKGKDRESSFAYSRKAVDLKERLAILTSILVPPPPTLPPSPPLSPRPFKRKSPDTSGENGLRQSDAVKRVRVGADASPSLAKHLSNGSIVPVSDSATSNALPPKPAAKKEEGELDDSLSGPKPPPTPPSVSNRAPRTRRIIHEHEFNRLRDSALENAKDLKRSGCARVSSGAPLAAKRYGVMEETDALLHFAYAFWIVGLGPNLVSSWDTLSAYLNQVKSRWQKLRSDPEVSAAEKGKAGVMIGLIELIRYCADHFLSRSYQQKLRHFVESSVASSPANNAASPPGNYHATHPTPPPPYTTNASLVNGALPTAPSPASSASSSNNSGHRHPAAHTAVSQSPQHNGNTHGVVSVPSDTLNKALQHANSLNNSAVNYSLRLTKQALRDNFPKTWAICQSDNARTGQPLFPGRREDHWQVDLDDCVKGQGEWSWPISSGEDVAYVVGFGRSLLWEYGLEFGGYRGVEGAWKNQDGTSFQNSR